MFMVTFPILEPSAKSVQSTAEVSCMICPQKSIAQGIKALGDELIEIVVVLAYPLRMTSVPSSDEHSDRS